MTQQNRLGRVGTRLKVSHGKMVVMYHDTPVVTFDDDHIILNSGGWKTATTKTRLNQASSQFNLGYYIYQKNWQWFVLYDNKEFPFVDGMTLERKGG